MVRKFRREVHEDRRRKMGLKVVRVPVCPAKDPPHIQEYGPLSRFKAPVQLSGSHQGGHGFSFVRGGDGPVAAGTTFPA
ncbi:hypothetical protein StoSoilB3_26390 [Arthrobacter sp. StoSoilB3]|nr:hypothetical protein NtRootA2_25460 [Arthrobacter sp. NtRootA2]BCW15346.1 hypothetical protein NtRootA4_23250 [Arthrobacter sp. NtRootA4]BCW23681.1 hypothetical protein NtRootC7_25480 [Arthrobacter sp. NtRootC7]BCW27949.1 hypothetical protein NtRootC45_25490 [Arthrobacter sp. NtRootC45]BCW32219.1 hypothetical protein NtRootD5_25500 [Arthrobacter sp. NtRootD5]BCW41104.1 hypothetical protein StoSoilB3_26390 [Arthrobacter sp. StoSoilB3]